jgi:hypothetical protein
MPDVVNPKANSNSCSPVTILSRFHDPDIFDIFICFFFFLNQGIGLEKFTKHFIFNSFADMKCERNHLKNILIHKLVVALEVVKQGLFVADIKILAKMVLQSNLKRRLNFFNFLFTDQIDSLNISSLGNLLLALIVLFKVVAPVQ